MHGLILKTLQVFVQDTYGQEPWQNIAAHAALDEVDFEAMLNYDEDIFTDVVNSASAVLDKPAEAILEDVGTYLVSHPNCEGLRRLLRFGGVDFIEFLHSLDDLPDRARLAVADLHLPDLELRDHTINQFQLKIDGHLPGFVHVMTGLLRAMADDYGALALLDHEGDRGDRLQLIDITVVETAYAEGRDFDLGAANQMGEAS
ncbi:Heme NO binding protein [Pelagimonas phthalicica]|uniref:Heme NO binding protein n=1 Tax=Pelagimonas phthalicica TaxID=1037362 RepID=A0A238JFB4_9RHOB|nr:MULTISPECIES: heme NO-binding domain-containing protein [Roseobacteraceae]MBO9468310.1 heme NO-binding domain-containing protein [Tropicibacter sp. R15_0]TDS92309.1 heme-NO-binding protein [Pelagimonas phthalicica]SMX29370.1 Heme NO binding protein [Pelagimonas phthalicica]